MGELEECGLRIVALVVYRRIVLTLGLGLLLVLNLLLSDHQSLISANLAYHLIFHRTL